MPTMKKAATKPHFFDGLTKDRHQNRNRNRKYKCQIFLLGESILSISGFYCNILLYFDWSNATWQAKSKWHKYKCQILELTTAEVGNFTEVCGTSAEGLGLKYSLSSGFKGPQMLSVHVELFFVPPRNMLFRSVCLCVILPVQGSKEKILLLLCV